MVARVIEDFVYSDSRFCGHESYAVAGTSSAQNLVQLSPDNSKILFNAEKPQTLEFTLIVKAKLGLRISVPSTITIYDCVDQKLSTISQSTEAL